MPIKLSFKDWVYKIYFKIIHWNIVLFFLPIIQYKGCQKEEHSMEINLVILGQPILLSFDQENYFDIKCNSNSC